jgi:chromosome segregation ATPase
MRPDESDQDAYRHALEEHRRQVDNYQDELARNREERQAYEQRLEEHRRAVERHEHQLASYAEEVDQGKTERRRFLDERKTFLEERIEFLYEKGKTDISAFAKLPDAVAEWIEARRELRKMDDGGQADAAVT